MLPCLQDIIPTDDFESLAEGLSGSFSCLKSFLPSIASQLGPLLAVLPETDVPRTQRPQPKSDPPMPSADTMRRGAEFVAAALCHMPAADVQVGVLPIKCFESADYVPHRAYHSSSTAHARLPGYLMQGLLSSWRNVQVLRTRLAGKAAETMLASIPALQAQCAAGPASSSGPATARKHADISRGAATTSSVPAANCSRAADSAGLRADAQAARMRARQRAHAAHVHRRFMCKLLGSPDQSSKGAVGPSGAATHSMDAARALARPAVQGGEGDPQEHAAPCTMQDKAVSVREQVQTLIEAATDVGNLAQMYEGWSAWI